MLGMALEGGGARGAYQIGVYKAYLENGYKFDGFVGTSIGAINAAAFASGNFDIALELWENISIEQLFDEEIAQLLTPDRSKMDKNLSENVKSALSNLIANRGIETSKIRDLLSKYIHEDDIRASGIDLGLATFSISDKKAYDIFLEDIPKGQLLDYIMASSNFPMFTRHTIDDKKFIDDGVYNNCPINMLIEKGYDEIVVVRTNSLGIFRRYDKNANITVLEAGRKIGKTLSFSKENSAADIKLGYLDGLRVVQNLQGGTYYLKNADLVQLKEKMLLLDETSLVDLHLTDLDKTPKNRLLLERVIPELAIFLKLGRNFTYEEFLLATLEYVALKKKVPVQELYEFDEFLAQIKEAEMPKVEKNSFDNFLPNPKEEREKWLEQLSDILLK